jgi:hypothetical protein
LDLDTASPDGVDNGGTLTMRSLVRARHVVALAAITTLLLVALNVTLALGADFLNGKVRSGDTIIIPSSETVDHDLYLFGGTITVDGTVNGDLVVAGGTVRVNGPVSGDVLVAGGDVQLTGDVAGDVRVASGQAIVTGKVGEDLAAGVGTLNLAGSVGGDLIFGAGQVTVSGPVTGSVLGSAGSYSNSSTVGGSQQVTITRAQAPQPAASNWLLDAIRQFVVVLVFGALALWLAPRAVAAAETALRRRTLLSFGTGILALIGYVLGVLVIVLAMVVLAFLFGVLTLGAVVGIELFAGFVAILAITLGYIVAGSFLADALVGLAVARTLLPAIGMRSRPDRWQDFGLLAAGAALVVIVTSLPAVGWIVKLAVVLFGLGVIFVAAWLSWRGRPVDPTVSSPPMGPPPTAAPAAGA